MTISIWRYSHFILAISSAFFLLIASVTGAILAYESAENKVYPYYISESENLPISEVLETLVSVYPKMISVSKDNNDFVIVNTVIEGRNTSFYVNPFTGEKLGGIIAKRPVYKLSTSLHRSLFLKKTGRLIIGFIAFMLLLITFSGMVIIAKRQGGYIYFFSKIVKENFSQYYHIIISRWIIIPLVLVTISGIYLSLLRFNVIAEPNVKHAIDFDNIKNTPKLNYAQFNTFKTHKLSDLKTINFPFSDFIEDYFQLQLETKEVIVNQYTGEILSETNYSNVRTINKYMSAIHVGSHNLIWAIVLGLTMILLLFLMYSGFYMRFKRPKSIIKNKHAKKDCTHIILVGSESNTTINFANLLHEQLLSLGIRSFLAELNDYAVYPKMEELLIFTATYGSGEPPSNANKFLALFSYIKQTQPYSFSVLGFGSTAYPDFCKFAYTIENTLVKNILAQQSIPIHTVNNQSFESFSKWANLWSGKNEIELKLDKTKVDTGVKPKPVLFEVLSNSSVTKAETTFLLQLKTQKRLKYNSGDLLAVFSKRGAEERLYSISKMKDNSILMSVKKHNYGVCSNYMSTLQKGDSLKGYIVKNNRFHFPKKGNQVVMIATGTGIGPFLGMIQNNTKKTPINLYWGAKTETSYKLYKTHIESSLKEQKLNQFTPVYSRASVEKIYVQHAIKNDADKIAHTLMSKGVIMICGSIAMQKQVLEVLDAICMEKLNKKLSFYQNRSQIKMDCY